MRQPLRFRNAQGELVDVDQVSVTKFKNELAAMFEQAALGRPVAITRHNTPKAVLISYDEFRAVLSARSPSLGALEAEFDALLEGMQSPASRKALATAYDAAPVAIGRAAVKAATASAPQRHKRTGKRAG